MKNIILFCLLYVISACSQPKEFNEESLGLLLKDTENNDISFQQILEKHKGKKILIDIWASWCSDCIKAMPEIKKIKADNPTLVFVNLSCDRNYQLWLSGIEKHQLAPENYLIPKEIKEQFNKAFSLNWIPRYLLINEDGSIFQYKATKPSDIKITEFLNQ